MDRDLAHQTEGIRQKRPRENQDGGTSTLYFPPRAVLSLLILETAVLKYWLPFFHFCPLGVRSLTIKT